jgi:hypothetical protein
VADVFTVARVDNNHPLNTLLMCWMGDWADWWVYRIPALLAGLGSIAMAMRITGRRGRPHAIAAGALFAISFPMVLYSTEARGYGLLIFFSLWAIDILDQYHADPRNRRCIVFALAVVLGCLSNSTFVLGYAAMLIWSIFQLGLGFDRRTTLKRLLLVHGFPIVFIAAYFLLFVLRLEIGGSEGATACAVTKQSLGLATGLANGTHANIFTAAVGLGFCVAILLAIGRYSGRLIALFLPGILLVPLVILLIAELRGETRLSPRHFLAAMVLFLLAAAVAFGESWKRRGALRIAATALFTCLIAANLFQNYQFDQSGRGHYLDAFSFMLSHNDNNPTLTLSSDFPNRTQMILDFYWHYVPHNTPLQYILAPDVARAQPNWYIGESDSGTAPERVIDGLRYGRGASYPCYGLSGESWTIYQRVR